MPRTRRAQAQPKPQAHNNARTSVQKFQPSIKLQISFDLTSVIE